MCLIVKTSSVRTPISVKPVFKVFSVRGYYDSREFCTPYQRKLAPFGDGHFVAFNATKCATEFKVGSSVWGGCLHSSVSKDGIYATRSIKQLLTSGTISPGNDVRFPAFALDVLAHGINEDVISRGLYVPAFDLRNYTDAEIRRLARQYRGSFTSHTRSVLTELGRPHP